MNMLGWDQNNPNPSPMVTITTTNTTVPNPSGSGQYVISNGYTPVWSDNISQSTLHVQGDANFENDIKVKGKSLIKTLEMIEEKLAILHPNETLEKKWEQLRELRKQYIQLEEEIKEKEKIWQILQK